MSPRKLWRNFEKEVARRHRGRHLGGPGQPDYIRGNTQGEVKLRSAPLSKAEVMVECRKGRKEICCNMGFSFSAEYYVQRYRPDVKLFTEPTNQRRY